MALIARSRVVDSNPVGEYARFDGQIIHSVDEAMALLPGNQRLAQAQRGRAHMDYDLFCYVTCDVLGTTDDDMGHLVVEYSVWETQAAQQNGNPPVFSNTHIFSYPTNYNNPVENIEYHIRETIIRHELAQQLGDKRAPFVRTTTARDPHGIYNNSGVQQLRGVQRIIDERNEPVTTNNRRLKLRGV